MELQPQYAAINLPSAGSSRLETRVGARGDAKLDSMPKAAAERSKERNARLRPKSTAVGATKSQVQMIVTRRASVESEDEKMRLISPGDATQIPRSAPMPRDPELWDEQAPKLYGRALLSMRPGVKGATVLPKLKSGVKRMSRAAADRHRSVPILSENGFHVPRLQTYNSHKVAQTIQGFRRLGSKLSRASRLGPMSARLVSTAALEQIDSEQRIMRVRERAAGEQPLRTQWTSGFGKDGKVFKTVGAFVGAGGNIHFRAETTKSQAGRSAESVKFVPLFDYDPTNDRPIYSTMLLDQVHHLSLSTDRMPFVGWIRHNFSGADEGGGQGTITISVNEVVSVSKIADGNWCLARRRGGERGWIPLDYVQPFRVAPPKVDHAVMRLAFAPTGARQTLKRRAPATPCRDQVRRGVKNGPKSVKRMRQTPQTQSCTARKSHSATKIGAVWVRYFCPLQQKHYYHNRTSGRVQWKPVMDFVDASLLH